jgi:ATP-dependent DNA helicase PIF1
VPPIPNWDNESGRNEFAKFWGRLVKAENPDPARSNAFTAITNALTASPTEIRNDFHFLSDIVNRVQRHGCNETYCLRFRQGACHADQRSCRFYFPRPLKDKASVSKDLNPNHWTFDSARHDQRNESTINNYNRLIIIMAWLANIDVSPCTSAQAVLHYIAKYASKAETRSESLKDIAKSLVRLINPNARNATQSLMQRLMNKLVGERDWSAQEVHHILIGNPL